MSSKALFSPIKVGTNTLKHRVVLAPLTRFRATPEAVPTDLQAKYYEQRASNGGLLVTEATFISRLAGAYPQAPGIYNQAQIDGWKKITSAVHAKGGVFFFQLWHIGRVGSKYLNPNQEQVVSASDIPSPGKALTGADHEIPRALTIDEIKSIVGEYAQAAKNAIEAGFDGVEIHGANATTVLTFAVDLPRTVVMASDNVEETWGYLVSELQKNHPKLAYLHLIESRADLQTLDHKNTVDTLESYRKIWKGPFITAGGFSTSLEFGNEIAEKTGDLVAYGRAFIANPDLPERLRNGWELNPYNRDDFYSHGAEGYTDYPFYNEKK
ncbi:hypothetical protein MBANPS3_012312 [Mucor bainieri]